MDTKDFNIDRMKPLYTLTIGEFIELSRQMVQNVLIEYLPSPAPEEKDESFNIPQLAKFLNCSLVSLTS